MYTASNPTDSAILAWRALRIKGATTMDPLFKSCLNLVGLFIGIPPKQWEVLIGTGTIPGKRRVVLPVMPVVKLGS